MEACVGGWCRGSRGGGLSFRELIANLSFGRGGISLFSRGKSVGCVPGSQKRKGKRRGESERENGARLGPDDDRNAMHRAHASPLLFLQSYLLI